MNAHLKSSLILTILTPALLSLCGCQLSTPESRAQNVTAVASRKSITAQADQLQPIKLLPVDESSLDPSFQEFRNQLMIAVTNRDKGFVLSVLDPKVDNGYDIEPGVKEFKRRWKLDEPETTMWDVLTGILADGGSFNETRTEFCAPYVVSQWDKVVRQLPEGTDTLGYLAIKGKDVAVRTDPHLTAPVVATLSYDVVQYVSNSQVIDRSNPGASSWSKIKTPTGPEGFVLDIYLGSPMDYGVCFIKRKDKWVMTMLATHE